MTKELLPCPFCGAGETQIHVNKGTWTGAAYGEPVSVEIRHWCDPEPGQPSRGLVRVGRDEASAIDAWNRRAYIDADRAKRKPLTDEQCDAIAIALDKWGVSISRDFGLPLYYEPEVWRGIIARAALNTPPRPDAGNN